MTEEGHRSWGREQEDALRAQVAEARAELDEAHRVGDRDAAFRADRRWQRALALVGDRIVALEADGAGEIAEVRRQLAWHEETGAAIRRALRDAGDVEQALRGAADRLDEAGDDGDLADLGAVLAAVDEHLAELAATTRRIGLTGRGAQVPPVAWSPPTGATDVLGLPVESTDAAARAGDLADGRQRVAETLSWVQTLQQLLADRRRATDDWDVLARRRLQHLVLAHLGER